MAANRANARLRHVPMRTCIVCRETKPKRELTRLVRPAGQSLVIDPGGKLAGRGAYLCSDPVCWQGAAQGGALDKALKTELDDQDRELLASRAQELEQAATPG